MFPNSAGFRPVSLHAANECASKHTGQVLRRVSWDQGWAIVHHGSLQEGVTAEHGIVELTWPRGSWAERVMSDRRSRGLFWQEGASRWSGQRCRVVR